MKLRKEELDAFSIEKQNQLSLSQLRTRFAQMAPQMGIISDIDECLVHTVGQHVKLINRGARLFGFHGSLPTIEDVVASGGTSTYAQIFGMQDDEWEQMMKRIRDSRFVNQNANVYDTREAAILQGQSDIGLLGFVSAKPGTVRTYTTTQADLSHRLGFPSLPLVLRPESVPLSETSRWKLEVMRQIMGNTDKRLILVDDSIGTARAVEEYNQQFDSPRIFQVLYEGPLTKPLLASGRYVPNEVQGIFPANWDEMPHVFDRIKQQ